MYYQFTNSSEQDLRNQMEKEGYQHVLYRLMLEEIVKLESIKITDKEVKAELKDLSEKYGMKEEEVEQQFGGKEMIQYDLEMRKAIEMLKEANK